MVLAHLVGHLLKRFAVVRAVTNLPLADMAHLVRDGHNGGMEVGVALVRQPDVVAGVIVPVKALRRRRIVDVEDNILRRRQIPAPKRACQPEHFINALKQLRRKMDHRPLPVA